MFIYDSIHEKWLTGIPLTGTDTTLRLIKLSRYSGRESVAMES